MFDLVEDNKMIDFRSIISQMTLKTKGKMFKPQREFLELIRKIRQSSRIPYSQLMILNHQLEPSNREI